MHLFRWRTGTAVLAPAKLNLFFEILAKRQDGFHEIETLAYPVDLCDTLSVENRIDGAIVFDCATPGGAASARGVDWKDIPCDDANLVVRALRLLQRESGTDFGATVRLVKRIPSQAGLGGGSSDAAAALAAANREWGLAWPASRLQSLGATLGSDIPLYFEQGPSICRGRGECVSPMNGVGTLHFVLARPPDGLATADVYRACRVPSQGRSRQLDLLIWAMRRGDIREIGRLLFNRLEEAAATLSPSIPRILGAMTREGCLASRMTGSGSCCFGLCRNRRHALRVARRLAACGESDTWAVRGSR